MVITMKGRYFISKRLLARRILRTVGPYRRLVDLHFDSRSPYFLKPSFDRLDVLNDSYGLVQCILKAINDPVSFEKLVRCLRQKSVRDIEATWALQFYQGLKPGLHPRMAALLVLARESLQWTARYQTDAPPGRWRRPIIEQVPSWLREWRGLQEIVGLLLQSLVVRNSPEELIEIYNKSDTLFYIDPPRCLTNDIEHGREYSRHSSRFLELLGNCEGQVIYCGAPDEVTDEGLSAWNRQDYIVGYVLDSGGKKHFVSETVWCNF